MLRASLRRFVSSEIAPYARVWEERGFTPRSLLEKMGELGYLGVIYPPEYGGQGGDIFSAIILAEELGRSGFLGVANTISVHVFMTLPLILRYGDEEQKEKYLKPGIAGKKLGAFAITEPGAGSDVSLIKTVAYKQSDRWLINGSKTFISNGTQADFALVVARTGQEPRAISVILADRDAPGYVVWRKLEKVGNLACDMAEIVFQDCTVPLSNLVGQEGKGLQQVMSELELDRLVVAAAASAAGELALEQAISYCRQRQQFGRSLITFQALQHRVADAATNLEAARQLLYSAAWKYKHNLRPVKEIAMAKLLCTEAAFTACDCALQLHGGYGYTMEYPVQRLWRDLRAWRLAAGTDEIMREIIAGQMQLAGGTKPGNFATYQLKG